MIVVNVIKWLFWKLWYFTFEDPQKMNMREFIEMLIRTRSPFWKFEPSVIRDSHGDGWVVCFRESTENTYTQDMQITVAAEIDEYGELYSIRMPASRIEAAMRNLEATKTER